MNVDAWITLGVIVAMLVTLAVDRFPPAGVLFGATFSLLLFGVIDTTTAFAGRLLSGTSQVGAMARLLVPTAVASSVFPNTPLVAMLIPDIIGWCRRRGISPSRSLLPLSFASLLGGIVTVIGTSTNLVVSGLLDQDGDPLGVFEMTAIGLPTALAGLAYLVFIGGRLVPDRLTPPESAELETREFSMTLQVVEDGPLAGKTVAEAGLRDLSGVFLVRIQSAEGAVVAPVSPDRRVSGGDTLTFVGNVDNVDNILDLTRLRGLRSTEHDHLLALNGQRQGFHEAVISRSSPLVGTTIKDAAFRDTYQAAVVAIHRSGHRLDGKLGDIELRHGDTLLLLAGPSFRRNWQNRPDFLVIAPVDADPLPATSKAPLVALTTAAARLLRAQASRHHAPWSSAKRSVTTERPALPLSRRAPGPHSILGPDLTGPLDQSRPETVTRPT